MSAVATTKRLLSADAIAKIERECAKYPPEQRQSAVGRDIEDCVVIMPADVPAVPTADFLVR